MKKLFFYAAAAVAMLAGCQKSEIAGPQAIDDNQPAAIKFGIDAPALTTTKAATKAAVDAWANTEVFVYGLKQERNADLSLKNLGEGLYNFDDILIEDYRTIANPTGSTEDWTKVSPLEVYKDATKKMPYYYAEGETYDFYGYHLGGAVPQTAVKDADVIKYPVTIAGNNDVMYAYTDRTADVVDGAAHGVETYDLYSAWAARRGVQPTLKFEHALTRFNFIIKGEGNAAGGTDNFSQVTITGIKLDKMVTTGTLTVVGPQANLGFVADAVEETAKTPLALKTIDASGADVDYVAEPVTANAENKAAGNSSCLMVAPNLASVKVVVNMVNNTFGTDTDNDGKPDKDFVELPNYEFEVKAENIKDAQGNALGTGAKFEAGKSYNIIIKVKGPKDIQIEAALTEWEIAGDYEYDSDIRPGGLQNPTPSAPEYEEVDAIKTQLTATATEDEFKEYLPESYWKNDEGEFDQDKYNAAQATFPWIVSVFTQKIPANSIIKVQVKYDGAVVTLDPAKIKWVGSEIAADGQSMTVTKTFDMSCVAFEVEGELGFNAAEVDLLKFEILVSVQK